jgi:hypothetical protein
MESRSCMCSIPSSTRRRAVPACLLRYSFFPSFIPYSDCCDSPHPQLLIRKCVEYSTSHQATSASFQTLSSSFLWTYSHWHHAVSATGSIIMHCQKRNSPKLDGREWLRNSHDRWNAIMHLFWNTDFPVQRQLIRNRAVRRTASSNQITWHVRDLPHYKRLTVIQCLKASLLPLSKSRWCPKPGVTLRLPYLLTYLTRYKTFPPHWPFKRGRIISQMFQGKYTELQTRHTYV